MNSVLIDAVLSTCSNYELLFDSLCWPAESWPGTERVGALTAFIEALAPLLDSPLPPNKQSLVDKIEAVVWERCLPLLGSGGAEGVCGREGTAALCRLVSVCVPLCDADAAGRVAASVLPSLQLSDDDTTGQDRLSVDTASELLAAVLPCLSVNEQLTGTILQSALSCIKSLPDALVSKITVRLLLPLLSCSGGERRSSIRLSIVEELCHWHAADRAPTSTERALLCLTALSDHLLHPRDLTSTLEPDPRTRVQFWRMLQDGLIHRDGVTRKRALYLLKSCVALSQEQGMELPHCPSKEDEILFKWAPESSKLLREFWEDYALVMETLEENQVHVVRPVLNRIDTLIQTTASDHQGQGLFHPSWLLCVYQRMFHSENKSLMREGVCHLLELQALGQPDFALAFSQFIVGPFMDVLSETSLFYKAPGQSVGDCPELVVKLQIFMTNFFSSLPVEHRGQVLLQILQQLGSKHWCAVPLLFLSQALAKLPPGPLLGVEGLAALREVLRCTMVTHQVLLRGAAQCFLLKSAFCLIDVSSVTLDDVFSFLMHFRADESLCRGNELWNQLCTWLSDNEGHFKPMTADGEGDVTNRDTIRGYVQDEVHAFLRVPASTGHTEALPDYREADKLARSVLLCADVEHGRPGAELGSTLGHLLSPLLEALSRVATNVYLPVRKSDKSLQLLLRLLQLSRGPSSERIVREERGDGVLVAMEKLVFELVDPIQEFILRRLCGDLHELVDVDRAELYLSVLKQLVMSSSQLHAKIERVCFHKLTAYSFKVVQEPNQQSPSMANQVSKAVAMASLALVCSLVQQEATGMRTDILAILKSLNIHFYSPTSSSTPAPLGHFNKRLMKPVDSSSDARLQGPLLQDWGRTAAQYMRDQWVCLSFLLKAVGVPESPELPLRVTESLKAALSCGVEALALLPSDLVLPVLSFMETLLPQLVHTEEELCVEAVTLTWQLVQGLSTNAHDFWPALRGFVSMAFHRQLLQLTDTQAPLLTAALKQMAAEVMELSESKSGVFDVLIQHCCETWRPTHGGGNDEDFSSIFSHIDILTEACVYGPVFRRDQRLVQDVQTYVEQLGDECPANAVVTCDNRDDQLPRTCALALLSRLDPINPLHERLMEDVVICLLEKDKRISKSKVRYYSNSLQHRVKNRVWQTLLLLLPKLKAEFVATLLNSVFEAGFSSNQASVKYLIEWVMIVILTRYPQHIDSFWACFSTDHERTKTSICTFLSVLAHFNIIIPALEDPAVHLARALDIILQWCFNHNFSVRLYALLALKRVWVLAEELGEEGAERLRGLSTVVKACLHQAEAMQSTGNANKNWVRIQEHFFFGDFHPIRDYSVETIFHTFPSLSELNDDEWIPPWKFEKLSCFLESPALPLRNPVADLRRLQPGDWIQQDKGEEDKEERWAEVQKKITPWRLGIQEQDPELQLVPQQRAARLGKLHGALLVVASLIDKPTNLGGLCRTCEIFGASALVLDSLRHIGDKHFQSLSVSSELWLPLLEVKPMELADFLQAKKVEGYCIVGVEQTANSHSLQEYQFPEKTLLLLGNEREGIPANLLQLLDVCVEIPQQGVIRSLNVHVSAALLIWEYTRQHLSSGPSQVTSESS